MKKGQIFTGNALKIIAMLTMLIDHIGFFLFPQYEIFRIIGRISFPLFAYLLVEGCRYTKDKKRHFLEIFLLGVFCQIAYTFVEQDLYLNILLTFSCSIPIIYALDKAKENKRYYVVAVLGIFFSYLLSEILPIYLSEFSFELDYGFAGLMLPVLLSLSKDKRVKLLLMVIGLFWLIYENGGYQWYCLFSLIFLILYNGKRGKWKMKYVGYLFYPLHFFLIYLLSFVL